MTISDLFNKLKSTGFAAPQKAAWSAVAKQAAPHNRRLSGDKIELIKKARPDESAEVTAYRIANFRAITYPSLSKHKSKVQRVLNYTINESDVLKSEGFDHEVISRAIIDDIYEDVNKVYFVLPYVVGEQIKPAELPPTAAPSLRIIHVASDSLIYYDNDFIAFKYGSAEVNKSKYDTYILADANDIFLAEPVLFDKEVVYALNLYYKKIVGDVDFKKLSPSATLPGIASKDDKGLFYLETFFKGAYDFYDEALTTFSDSQAVAWRYNYPKTVMAEINCPVTECNEGYIFEKDTLGNVIRDAGKPRKSKCSTCGGSGKITDPTIFKTLTYPTNTGLSAQNTRPLIEFVTPDVAIIESSFKRPFDLLKLGDKAIGLDLLESAGANSSDLSLERRMEDLLDMISAIGNGLYDALDNIMYNIELIRSPFAKTVNFTKVSRPSSFSLKTTGDLFAEANETFFEDRITAKLNAYRTKYKNNERLLKVYELILYCDPMSSMTFDEIANAQALGVLKDYDQVRHLHAFAAVEAALKKTNDLDLSVSDCQRYIREYLVDNGFWLELPLSNESI